MNLSHLKQLLAKNGISQTDLARLLRRDKAVITNLFQGKRQLKAEEAMVIASHIGVPVAQILGIHEPRGLAEPAVLIPFQSEPEMSKRNTGVVKKDGKFFLEMNDRGLSPKAYALEVGDDSMNLAGIMKGDIVISELDRPCKHGQIVIAQHYQGRGAKTLIRKYEAPLLLPYSTLAMFKPLRMDDTNARLVSPVLKLIRTY
jgi:transcriptional regulator with XRE-family HTH domain